MTARSPFSCALAAIGAATLFAACSGGGVTTAPIPLPVVPTPAPTTGAASVTVTPSSTAATVVVLPALTDAGITSQSVTIPPAVGAVSRVTVSVSTTAPAGSPALLHSRRPADGVPASDDTPIEYVSLSSVAPIDFGDPVQVQFAVGPTADTQDPISTAVLEVPNAPGFTAPATPINLTSSTWVAGSTPCAGGTCSLSGYSDAPGAPAKAVTHLSPTPLAIGLIQIHTHATPRPTSSPTSGASGTPSPSSPVATPSPTPMPTPTPSPSPVATPTPGPNGFAAAPSILSFSLDASGTAAQTFTVTENAYVGTFTTTDTCASYATVTGSSPTFTVTPIAAPAAPSTSATCTVSVNDALGNTVHVDIYISSLSVSVTARGRHS